MSKSPFRYIALPIIAFYLYMAGSAPFLGPWDSFDYLQGIATHKLSVLGVGRPVFIGYNILLWESMRKVFHLRPLQVEIVAMAGTVLLAVAGILLFQIFARRVLFLQASQMAAVALAVSPMYAIYSGYIMTEVPMLVALIVSASVLWGRNHHYSKWKDIAGGVLFGLAVGYREQALTLSAAFLWILYSRRDDASSRRHSIAYFGIAAGAVILAPVFVFYLNDPTGFVQRSRTWLQAIPMGRVQFWNNVSASLAYGLGVCPGAWLAVAGAGIYRLVCRMRPSSSAEETRSGHKGDPSDAIHNPIWGIVCCLLLPIASLWRDADVQIHPRYALVILPASLIFCTLLYWRWMPPKRGPIIWAIANVLVFGITLAIISPYRQNQIQKLKYATIVREAIPGDGLLIAGSYSPVFDYYRGIGVRPGWKILWSGWDWDVKKVEAKIHESWANHTPVYVCENALAWSYLEEEFLDLIFLLKECKKEQIAPNLFRVYPGRSLTKW